MHLECSLKEYRVQVLMFKATYFFKNCYVLNDIKQNKCFTAPIESGQKMIQSVNIDSKNELSKNLIHDILIKTVSNMQSGVKFQRVSCI